MEFLMGAAGGLIAGGVLMFVEFLINRRDKQREIVEARIVKFTNEERRITGSIFNYLGPRSSVELMKSELGPPNKKTKELIGLFSEDEINESDVIHTYVYYFKNAAVKIGSRDNETIDSLTVIATDKDISFADMFYGGDAEPKNEILNIATITYENIAGCRAEHFPGCRDVFTAAQKAIGPPFYIHLTYIVHPDVGDEVANNPELLIGSVIEGICLSSESRIIPYIYISDMV